MRNLLQIQGPAFDAETVDPRSLLVGRGCALETLTLTGNSIGDEGVDWLVFLLKHSGRLSTLNLRQCAVEASGAESLASQCAVESSGAESLKHLDLRDNDLGDASADLAHVAAASLSDLNGGQVVFADLRRQLKLEFSTSSSSSSSPSSLASPSSSSSSSSSSSGLVLAPGQDSMCHGVLAVLFALRRCTEEVSSGGGGVGGAVTLDLRGTQACGYYQERGEVPEELLSQLSGGGEARDDSDVGAEEDAQDARTMEGGEANAATTTAATTASTEVATVAANGSNETARRTQAATVIKKVLLDDDTGFSDRQVRLLYEACDPDVTEVFLNDAAYEPPAGWAAGCAMQ